MITNQSNSSPIESAARTQAKLFAVYIAVLIVGALLAALFTFLVWRAGNKYVEAVKADADARTAEAVQNAARAIEEAAKANERAGRLEIEAAAQRERAAKAETALLKLQEQVKPRKVTPAQRGQLIPLLKQGPVSNIMIDGISDESEVSNFCRELGSALREGGFNLLGYGVRSEFETFSGLKVLAVTIEDPAAIALHKSLNKVGLSASFELNPENRLDPKMRKVPSYFFDENDPFDRLAKQMSEPCNVLCVGFKPEA